MSIQPNRCREYAWHQEICAADISLVPITMMSKGEQLMLHWLAKNVDLSSGGCIVDAGCFLGGSTVALASGLAKNQSGHTGYRIHTYDIFIAPKDNYCLGLIGNGKNPGDSVLDLFANNLGYLTKHVVVHSGDLLASPPPQSSVELLFIDIAKTRDLNAKIVREFFPLLIPGRSIVVQQDHNDHSCPWVNATMQKLKDYFEILCDDSSSRVYLLKTEIPEGELEATASMELDEEFAHLQQFLHEDPSPYARFFTAVSTAWTIIEKDGVSAAVAHLNSLDGVQPWESDEPYIELVKRSVQDIGSQEGLNRFHKGYFAEAN